MTESTYTHLKRYERPSNFADFGDVPRGEYYVAYGQTSAKRRPRKRMRFGAIATGWPSGSSTSASTDRSSSFGIMPTCADASGASTSPGTHRS